MNPIKSYSAFLKTRTNDNPEDSWSDSLVALWYDARGNWKAAHERVDGKNDANAKWVHAYLHRKEGDEWNAGYWYRQAGKPFPKVSLQQEHQDLVEFMLLTS